MSLLEVAQTAFTIAFSMGAGLACAGLLTWCFLALCGVLDE